MSALLSLQKLKRKLLKKLNIKDCLTQLIKAQLGTIKKNNEVNIFENISGQPWIHHGETQYNNLESQVYTFLEIMWYANTSY